MQQPQPQHQQTGGGWTPWQLTGYRVLIAAGLLILFLLPAVWSSEMPAAAAMAAGAATALLATPTQWSRLAAAVIAAVLLMFVPFRLMPEPPLFAALLFAMLAAPKRISPAALHAAQAAAILSLVACAVSPPVHWLAWWSILIGIPAAIPPAWMSRGRKTEDAERLFYDGGCGLCHHTVQFLLAEDPEGRLFRFAPLGSQAFVQAIPDETVRSALPDSVVVRTADGTVLYRSAAAIHVLHRLGGYWRLAAWIGQALPGALLDALYDGIAAIRHRVFRKPADVCPMMPRDLRARFDL